MKLMVNSRGISPRFNPASHDASDGRSNLAIAFFRAVDVGTPSQFRENASNNEYSHMPAPIKDAGPLFAVHRIPDFNRIRSALSRSLVALSSIHLKTTSPFKGHGSNRIRISARGPPRGTSTPPPDQHRSVANKSPMNLVSEEASPYHRP